MPAEVLSNEDLYENSTILQRNQSALTLEKGLPHIESSYSKQHLGMSPKHPKSVSKLETHVEPRKSSVNMVDFVYWFAC